MSLVTTTLYFLLFSQSRADISHGASLSAPRKHVFFFSYPKPLQITSSGRRCYCTFNNLSHALTIIILIFYNDRVVQLQWSPHFIKRSRGFHSSQKTNSSGKVLKIDSCTLVWMMFSSYKSFIINIRLLRIRNHLLIFWLSPAGQHWPSCSNSHWFSNNIVS